VVSTARLNQFENDGSLPNLYKFYSLAVIYRLSIEEMLGAYGIDVGEMEQHRQATLQSSNHVFTFEVGGPAGSISFPVRFDPKFRPQKTSFLSRFVEAWGEIPAGLLNQLDFKKYRYGFIGLEDQTMTRLLRPGSIVQIDDSRGKIVNSGWLAEYDRPIYFWRCATATNTAGVTNVAIRSPCFHTRSLPSASGLSGFRMMAKC
jgi:hypothetical protein